MIYLDWAVLAASFYNTISLLWLGLTVLLNGDRRAVGTWISGGGLVLGGVLFISHTAILGRGLATAGLGMDFWWWVSWGPAIAVPLAWYGVMLWHAGFHLGRPHPHRAWLLGVVVLLAMTLGGLFLSNPMPTYSRLAGDRLVFLPDLSGVPLLIVTYLLYSFLCYILPLDLLRRPVSEGAPLTAVARRQARPWLVAVSALLLLAGAVMIWTAIWAVQPRDPPATLADPAVDATVKRFDLAVAGLVALAITLLGRAIVAYAVFTGHPLPRRGFFRQWRSTVILAAGFSFVIGAAWAAQLRPFYGLMLAALVMTLFHALFSWRSFAEREQFMAQLRPFVASQGLYDRVRAGTPPDPAQPQAFFETLCRDVLGARTAVLVPAGALATLAGPPLVYAPGGVRITVPPVAELAAWFPSAEMRYRPASEVGAAWAVALRQERGLGGVLLLGEKLDGNPYSEEEIEIAQAGGERLLDTLAGAEMAGVAMRLLRQRLGQVKVLESQGRRTLHDQVLPRLHTAILQLSARRDDPAVREAVAELTAAHREISDLMHDVTSSVPHGLAQQGLAVALRGLVDQEFAGDFQAVDWQVSAEAAREAGKLAPFVAEVVYFAARELVRNAASHGRGGDQSRPLRLTVRIEVAGELRLLVEDNGVGLAESQGEPTAGSGSGLRFHSTMLAAVGGRLEVVPLLEGGTRGSIAVPLGP
jgi:signal transduction histidine kinase